MAALKVKKVKTTSEQGYKDLLSPDGSGAGAEYKPVFRQSDGGDVTRGQDSGYPNNTSDRLKYTGQDGTKANAPVRTLKVKKKQGS